MMFSMFGCTQRKDSRIDICALVAAALSYTRIFVQILIRIYQDGTQEK